jgi:hypothetical protein
VLALSVSVAVHDAFSLDELCPSFDYRLWACSRDPEVHFYVGLIHASQSVTSIELVF